MTPRDLLLLLGSGGCGRSDRGRFRDIKLSTADPSIPGIWPLAAQAGRVDVSTRSNALYDRYAAEHGCPGESE